jgi:hypothetical protein
MLGFTMSNDVFEEWKRNRFVIVDPVLVDDKERLIILTDYIFWADHTDELLDWCEKYGANNQGMTVLFPDEQTLTTFVLKWQ